jgi:uncharacterized protein YndB with AHSA1/START domain
MSVEIVKINALVNADVNKAWNCYVQPEHIVKWNFASDDWQCPWAENDLRIGGTYKARMEAKDGSFGFEFEAVYSAINEAESFTYVMPDGRNVMVKFTLQENGTLVEVEFDAETQNPVELQRQGWQAILNNYKAHTESI